MICYFDTSALVPLIIEEPSSETCEKLWASSSRLISSRLVIVEAKAAFAKAVRMKRITKSQLLSANQILGDLVLGFDYVELSNSVVDTAGELSQHYNLRGYDAVHLASCALVNDSDVVFASGDSDLLEAALSHGISIANTS